MRTAVKRRMPNTLANEVYRGLKGDADIFPRQRQGAYGIAVVNGARICRIDRWFGSIIALSGPMTGDRCSHPFNERHEIKASRSSERQAGAAPCFS